jgi:hypothetical protein
MATACLGGLPAAISVLMFWLRAVFDGDLMSGMKNQTFSKTLLIHRMLPAMLLLLLLPTLKTAVSRIPVPWDC